MLLGKRDIATSSLYKSTLTSVSVCDCNAFATLSVLRKEQVASVALSNIIIHGYTVCIIVTGLTARRRIFIDGIIGSPVRSSVQPIRVSNTSESGIEVSGSTFGRLGYSGGCSRGVAGRSAVDGICCCDGGSARQISQALNARGDGCCRVPVDVRTSGQIIRGAGDNIVVSPQVCASDFAFWVDGRIGSCGWAVCWERRRCKGSCVFCDSRNSSSGNGMLAISSKREGPKYCNVRIEDVLGGSRNTSAGRDCGRGIVASLIIGEDIGIFRRQTTQR